MVGKKEIRKVLEEVIDPETGVSIVKMGMVKGIKIKGKEVNIEFSPTTPFCPMIGYLVKEIERVVRKLGIDAKVEIKI
ncbi:MAG: iron-sulfur cluster assembly protein [Candidatus Aenigmatarchaeota archaeon]